ncbi:secretin and TonB N-terminal domain-containing protein [Providencia rettgeri]|uniref:secretin and TonB N-terminal domain-containing protein n=1 Tax=Providencia rettgeri TaxID=587 RepID=UPI001B36E181|nr:secretin and TonB N-terminal domain-containing protein [Providencia rettgeri]EHZ7764112.1 TonB-dependent receptor plug domain-containing protein [Providencia rettgeri]EIJ7167254.1 TonB-dependent receptor plug domain-containing protein [Providencia rettgeri]EJD6047706.1 TonB-dependent receptor plug domain-containing protein [Providencia rettgeri]ELR5090780.1 TonB-dependent receptor plug domain-containing protein [Providencia rettgeri]ELR5104094.1 TonB-dependent receptor plug domain-containin
MSIQFTQSRLRPLALAIAVSSAIVCQTAFAQEMNFSLPEQSLAASVAEISRQGQIQLIYDKGQLNGLRAPALSGNYSAQTALQKILIGSGLELVNENGVFVIRQQNLSQGTLVLPETQVSGVVQNHPATDVMSAPQYVTSEEISQKNTGDGNITDLMKTNPAVQFANNDSNSMNQGEIKPSRISIHGSSSYQNAYRLDGVSFNNDFDPADSGLGETATRLSSSDQGIYIDSRLIDSMTVYDNNIPVEFGGFTGGTVEVNSRRWQGENSAHAYYRLTRSGWNNLFHDSTQGIDTTKNDTANPARFQNRYDKNDFGGWFELGVSENSGLVFSASRRSSTIPMTLANDGAAMINGDGELEMTDGLTGKKDQKRISDNYFLKYTIDLSDKSSLDLSANYADYDSRLFTSTIMNSGYDSTHKGLGFTGVFKHQFEVGQLELTASTQQLKDERVNDQNYYVEVLAMDSDYNWDNRKYLRSGGQGDLISEQNSQTAKAVMRFTSMEDGLGITHKPTIGSELSYTKGTYKRDSDFYRYNYSGVIDKNDYWNGQLTNVTRFQAGKHSADYTNYALFLDDNLQYGKLTLRPGIRLDRDDFVSRTNIAPRLSGSYDIFGDNSTLLIAGANRYYGRSMLTYALYGAQNAGMQNCNWGCSLDPNLNDWDNQKDYEGVDSLKTPYNDELTVALQQEILSTTWRLQYVHREGYDEVRTRTKYDTRDADKRSIRMYDNGGRSSHDTVTLSVNNSQPWEWADASHVMTASLTWQQSESNTPKDSGYNSFDPANKVNLNKVWYDGKIIDASKLPSTSFNSPFKFNLELTSVWDDYDLTWYNRLQWWGARDQAVRYDNAYAVDPEYGQVRKYTKQHFSSKYTWDTRLGWKPEFAHGFGFSVEVKNILNNKNVADRFVFEDRVLKSYDPGRQFWLQVNYDL